MAVKTLYLSVTGNTTHAIASYLRRMAGLMQDLELEEPEYIFEGVDNIGTKDCVHYHAFLDEKTMHPFEDWFKRANYLDPDYDSRVSKEDIAAYYLRYGEELVYKAKSHTQSFEVVKRTNPMDNSLPTYAVYYTYYNSDKVWVATFETLSQATVAVEQEHGTPLVGIEAVATMGIHSIADPECILTNSL